MYNRYEQCQNCRCFYGNAEGEVKEALDNALIECSLELTYENHNQKCYGYQPIRGRKCIIPKLQPEKHSKQQVTDYQI